ncbi:hypothetical protein M514_04226, partial [Trichuris suis]
LEAWGADGDTFASALCLAGARFLAGAGIDDAAVACAAVRENLDSFKRFFKVMRREISFDMSESCKKRKTAQWKQSTMGYAEAKIQPELAALQDDADRETWSLETSIRDLRKRPKDL